MKKTYRNLLILVAILILVWIGIELLRPYRKLSAQTQTAASPSGCQQFTITIKKVDVGAIMFAAIPALIDNTGLKRITLESDAMIYEGSIDAITAFETIAQHQGWTYFKSNNC